MEKQNKEQILKELNDLETSAVNGAGFTPYISKKIHSLYAKLNKQGEKIK